jgi:hypothetical protein
MASTSTVISKKGKKSVAMSDGSTQTTQTDESHITTTEFDSLKTLVDELTMRVGQLETSVSSLKTTQVAQSMSPRKTDISPSKAEKKTRAPTAYNVFMKDKMLELKNTHPDVTNIERMRMAAAAWTESKATAESSSASSV